MSNPKDFAKRSHHPSPKSTLRTVLPEQREQLRGYRPFIETALLPPNDLASPLQQFMCDHHEMLTKCFATAFITGFSGAILEGNTVTTKQVRDSMLLGSNGIGQQLRWAFKENAAFTPEIETALVERYKQFAKALQEAALSKPVAQSSKGGRTV